MPTQSGLIILEDGLPGHGFSLAKILIAYAERTVPHIL